MLLRPLPLLFVAALAGCGPPELVVEGVGPVGGPYTGNAFVKAGEKTTLEGRLQNRGGQGTSAPELTFAELSCLEIDCAYSSGDIDGLAPGATHAFAIAFTPTDCSINTIVDWFLEADGEKYRGTFNLNLEQ